MKLLIIMITKVTMPAIINEQIIQAKMCNTDMGFTKYNIEPIQQIINIARKIHNDLLFIFSTPPFFFIHIYMIIKLYIYL